MRALLASLILWSAIRIIQLSQGTKVPTKNTISRLSVSLHNAMVGYFYDHHTALMLMQFLLLKCKISKGFD